MIYQLFHFLVDWAVFGLRAGRGQSGHGPAAWMDQRARSIRQLATGRPGQTGQLLANGDRAAQVLYVRNFRVHSGLRHHHGVRRDKQHKGIPLYLARSLGSTFNGNDVIRRKLNSRNKFLRTQFFVSCRISSNLVCGASWFLLSISKCF